MVQKSESEELKHCAVCGNVVSMLYVREQGSDDVWCIKCWDEKEETKEEERTDG